MHAVCADVMGQRITAAMNVATEAADSLQAKDPEVAVLMKTDIGELNEEQVRAELARLRASFVAIRDNLWRTHEDWLVSLRKMWGTPEKFDACQPDDEKERLASAVFAGLAGRKAHRREYIPFKVREFAAEVHKVVHVASGFLIALAVAAGLVALAFYAWGHWRTKRYQFYQSAAGEYRDACEEYFELIEKGGVKPDPRVLKLQLANRASARRIHEEAKRVDARWKKSVGDEELRAAIREVERKRDSTVDAPPPKPQNMQNGLERAAERLMPSLAGTATPTTGSQNVEEP
jgi:hypothetical protein